MINQNEKENNDEILQNTIRSSLGELALRTLLGNNDSNIKNPEYHIPDACSGVPSPLIAFTDYDGYWNSLKGQLQVKLTNTPHEMNGRRIHNVKFAFAELDSKLTKYHISSPMDACKLPYVYLYILVCDSIENYKAVCKPRLKSWIDSMKQPSNGLDYAEWFVIRLYGSGVPDSTPNQQSQTSKVWEKVKMDFGNPRRFFKLSMSSGSPTGNTKNTAEKEMQALVSALLGGISASFEDRAGKVSDQINKLESQKNVPGWNYCTYLILKENYAFMWMQLNLFYDAIRVYDSLITQFAEINDSEWKLDQDASKILNDMVKLHTIRRQMESQHKALRKSLSDPEPREFATKSESSTLSGPSERRLSFSMTFRPSDTSAPMVDSGSFRSSHSARMQLSRGASATSLNENGEEEAQALNVIPVVLLDIARKPYRQHIHQSSLSVLETQLYLFIRSTLILFRVDQPGEALRRSLSFISAFWKCIMASVTLDHSVEDAPLKIDLISIAWAFSACVEMACAGVSCDNFENSADVVFYCGELISMATTFWKYLLKLDATEVAESTEMTRDRRDIFFNNKNWVDCLPHPIRAFDRGYQGHTAANRAFFREWFPQGIFESLEDISNYVNRLCDIYSARGHLLFLARRYRAASSMDIRRCFMYMLTQRHEEANRVLTHILKAQSTTWKYWNRVIADLLLVKMSIQIENLQTRDSIETALQILALNATTREQRLSAHHCFQQQSNSTKDTGMELCDDANMGSDRFRLLQIRKIDHPQCRSNTDPIRARTHTVLDIQMQLNSSFPESFVCSKIQLRFDRCEEEMASPRDRAVSSQSLNSYRVDVDMLNQPHNDPAKVTAVARRRASTVFSSRALDHWTNTTECLIVDTNQAVTIRPGMNQFVLSLMDVPADKVGMFSPRAMAFEFPSLRMIQEIPRCLQGTRVEITPLESLFHYKIARPLGMLVIEDDRSRQVEIPLTVHPVQEGLQILSAAVTCSTPEESFCQITGTSMFRINDFSQEQNELTATLDIQENIFNKSIAIRCPSKQCFGGDGKLKKTNSKVNLLVEEQFKAGVLTLGTEFLIQCWSLSGNAIENSLSQFDLVDLEYQNPFEIETDVRAFRGKLWCQISIKSLCIYAVRISKALLGDNVEEMSGASSWFIPPKGTLFLTYSFADDHTETVVERYQLGFSMDFAYMDNNVKLCDDMNFERDLSFWVYSNQTHLDVRMCILNTNRLVVGYTIAVRYEVKWAKSKGHFVRCEGCYNSNKDEEVRTSVYQYTIISDDADWMVLGIRAGSLDISGDDAVVLCELIPLRDGPLSLPSIEFGSLFLTVSSECEFVVVEPV